MPSKKHLSGVDISILLQDYPTTIAHDMANIAREKRIIQRKVQGLRLRVANIDKKLKKCCISNVDISLLMAQKFTYEDQIRVLENRLADFPRL